MEWSEVNLGGGIEMVWVFLFDVVAKQKPGLYQNRFCHSVLTRRMDLPQAFPFVTKTMVRNVRLIKGGCVLLKGGTFMKYFGVLF